jgi:hypothetical protein
MKSLATVATFSIALGLGVPVLLAQQQPNDPGRTSPLAQMDPGKASPLARPCSTLAQATSRGPGKESPLVAQATPRAPGKESPW